MKARKQRSFLLTLAGIGLLVGVRMILSERSRYDLKGRVAIITGGARGLGLVLARHLAARGAKLVICSRTQSQLDSAARELEALGAEVLAIQCDVTERSQVDNLIEESIAHYGKIDVLINNAGVIQLGPANTMTEADYGAAMNIHFWAPLYTTLAVLPHFRARKEGRIVNIASIGGKVAVPHLLPYCASKFALVGLSEGMATELKRENILVSTITPSLMRTGSTGNISVKGNHEKEYAWFKTAASFSAISKEPTEVARLIIDALEYHNTHPVTSDLERVTSIVKQIFPQGIESLMSRINDVLPKESANGFIAKTGYESESRLSANRIARGADEDARLNNEL